MSRGPGWRWRTPPAPPPARFGRTRAIWIPPIAGTGSASRSLARPSSRRRPPGGTSAARGPGLLAGAVKGAFGAGAWAVPHPAGPARLAAAAPSGPELGQRPHGDRLDGADHRRTRPGAHRERHAAPSAGPAAMRAAGGFIGFAVGTAGRGGYAVGRGAAARAAGRLRAAGHHRHAAAPGAGPARRTVRVRAHGRRAGEDTRPRGRRDRRAPAAAAAASAGGDRGRRARAAVRQPAAGRDPCPRRGAAAGRRRSCAPAR